MIMQRSVCLIIVLKSFMKKCHKMFNASRIVGNPPTMSDTTNINFKFLSSLSSMEKEKQYNMKKSNSYEDAIQQLNALQSNASTIKKSILKKQKNNLEKTVKYLNRSGLTLDDLDKLSVIHVSGTKGKGSTCALTESILRSFGMKTGFFSSPHLISVTERFRLNGKPISQEKFVEYFWKVYKRLDEQKDDEIDMPAYFNFLTILCFHIFIAEQVDVAIIEVGIGGENDCTNIVRNTKTIGITSLALEHVNLLGDTLEKIAWQKAGIIKDKSNVFTIQQPDECIKIIQNRIKEKNANLFIAPDLAMYKWKKSPILQIQNKVQNLNASLAIQLSYDWLRQNKLQHLNGFSQNLSENKISVEISDNINEGLEKCYWPGRCQFIEYHNFRIYLDGAHTIESIDICIDWFKKSTNESKNSKVLIFNSTGDRNSIKLLEMLNKELKFNKAYFVPNIPYNNVQKKNIDNSTVYSNQEQIERAKTHSNYWNSNSNNSNYYSCILDAFNDISKDVIKMENVDVLVTGSLHLIGATLLAVEEHEKLKFKSN